MNSDGLWFEVVDQYGNVDTYDTELRAYHKYTWLAMRLSRGTIKIRRYAGDTFIEEYQYGK